MADVAIPEQHWRSLRRSANCYIPKLVRASASQTHGFTNSELHRAGQAQRLDKEFSLHIIGNVMLLKAVTHGKAEQLLEAYLGLPEDLQAKHGPLSNSDIVAALFAVPRLQELMDGAKLSKEELAAQSSVSLGCIEHTLSGGRVTASIAGALRSALLSRNSKTGKTGTFQDFVTSRVSDTVGHKAVKGTPFGLDDLLLPLPSGAPEKWP
ncbi:hypothetical protein [Sphingosinicella sp.]|uniref:hypothetical protein n=1 Tax=Sphingosinicella sp. TaxID=1917971 RepID=UPI004037CE68